MKKLFLCLLFICLMSPRSWAAFSVLASTCEGQNVDDGSDFTSSTIDTSGANLIVVYASHYATSLTLTDSRSNTWQPLTEVGGVESSDHSQLFYTWGSLSVGVGHTFTISQEGNLFHGLICVMALSGAQTSSDPIDGSDITNENTATTIQTGEIVPNFDNEIVVTAVSSSSDNPVPTIDSGFTVAASYANVSFTGNRGAIAYLIQTTATAVNPTWDLTSNLANRSVIASFKFQATTPVVRHRPIIIQ